MRKLILVVFFGLVIWGVMYCLDIKIEVRAEPPKTTILKTIKPEPGGRFTKIIVSDTGYPLASADVYVQLCKDDVLVSVQPDEEMFQSTSGELWIVNKGEKVAGLPKMIHLYKHGFDEVAVSQYIVEGPGWTKPLIIIPMSNWQE